MVEGCILYVLFVKISTNAYFTRWLDFAEFALHLSWY